VGALESESFFLFNGARTTNNLNRFTNVIASDINASWLRMLARAVVHCALCVPPDKLGQASLLVVVPDRL
jgi:hypothetical protein